MDSYRSTTYHIVIVTKYRAKVIPDKESHHLYNYLWGILRNRNCHLYRINGIEDHIHIVCDIHPSIAVADLVKELKVASSKWMKHSGLFPDFCAWSPGYGVFTYSKADRSTVINYVKNQQIHHKRATFREEFRKILDDFGVAYDDRFLP
ncbi:MAG: IS200/IS605 family transposase [Bacteroidales bacterium]|nr:IS200/IS605 family transposase [Bacteroidales bacterium]